MIEGSQGFTSGVWIPENRRGKDKEFLHKSMFLDAGSCHVCLARFVTTRVIQGWEMTNYESCQKELAAGGVPVRYISRARRNAATAGHTLQEMQAHWRVPSFRILNLSIDWAPIELHERLLHLTREESMALQSWKYSCFEYGNGLEHIRRLLDISNGKPLIRNMY